MESKCSGGKKMLEGGRKNIHTRREMCHNMTVSLLVVDFCALALCVRILLTCLKAGTNFA